MSEHVILVDRRDRATGTEEKMSVHRSGRLHRAFSAIVLNDADEMLLQRRAADKYHSGGLWSNTCCSHPRPGEEIVEAGRRRLAEEMGFECDLEPAFEFIYRTELAGGLVEHEYDHVLLGRWNGTPHPDPAEVDDWRWVPLDELRQEVARYPTRFTYWFRVALRELDDRDLLPGSSREQVA